MVTTLPSPKVELLPGLIPTLDYNSEPPTELTPDITKERLNLFINNVTDRIISSIESGQNQTLIFPMRGSLLHYFFIMQELARRKFIDFDKVDFLFSYKAKKRDGGKNAYDHSRERDPDADPEEYVITTPKFSFDPANPVIVVEDLKETGSSVDASAIAYWNAAGLPERPFEKVVAIYSSVKHVPGPSKYNIKYSVQVDVEGTQNLNGNWITAGPGLDGGITENIENEELKLLIEIFERLCGIYIERPDFTIPVINNDADGIAYLNYLQENSLLNDYTQTDASNHILFRLLQRVNGKNPEQMVRFMHITHGMAINYINSLNNES